MPGEDRPPRDPGPALAHPEPPLRDALVALRPWRGGDVPERPMAFADPLAPGDDTAVLGGASLYGLPGELR